jgi:hypothetical protein
MEIALALGAVAGFILAVVPVGAAARGVVASMLAGGLHRGTASGNRPLDIDSTLDTDTPTSTPTTAPCTDYAISTGTAVLVPATTLVGGSQCDECTRNIALPFPVQFYGQSYTSAQVGDNGTLGFSANSNGFFNTCLPNAGFNNAVLPHWDDLDMRTTLTTTFAPGIYTSTTGTQPNRRVNIEWRACIYTNGTCDQGRANFEISFFENAPTITMVYGATANNGFSATSGLQQSTGTRFTQFSCNTPALTNGLRVDYNPVICGTPTATRTPTRTGTPTLSPTSTRTPTPAPTCGAGADYSVFTQEGAPLDPGTNDTGNHCDDCASTINLPFTYYFYGVPFNTLNVTSNGNAQFLSSSTAFNNSCLPDPSLEYAILPYWDDLRTDGMNAGIFTDVSGPSGSRVLNIEWRSCIRASSLPCTGVDTNFELRLYENQDRFDVIYGPMLENGGGATVGVQRATGVSYTQYSCDTASLSDGLQLIFRPLLCGEATSTPTATPTGTPQAGTIVGHVTWQGIPQNNSRSALPITLTLKLGTTEVNYPAQTTDASGFFTANVGGLTPGTYGWRVQSPDGPSGGNTGPGFLANCGALPIGLQIEDYKLKITEEQSSIFNFQPSIQFEGGLMKGGDANNDNLITAQDFNILKSEFGLGGVRRSDFDNSGVVNAQDFNILKGNFGQSGCAAILSRVDMGGSLEAPLGGLLPPARGKEN